MQGFKCEEAEWKTSHVPFGAIAMLARAHKIILEVWSTGIISIELFLPPFVKNLTKPNCMAITTPCPADSVSVQPIIGLFSVPHTIDGLMIAMFLGQPALILFYKTLSAQDLVKV